MFPAQMWSNLRIRNAASPVTCGQAVGWWHEGLPAAVWAPPERPASHRYLSPASSWTAPSPASSRSAPPAPSPHPAQRSAPLQTFHYSLCIVISHSQFCPNICPNILSLYALWGALNSPIEAEFPLWAACVFHPELVRLVPSRFLMPEEKNYIHYERKTRFLFFLLKMYIIQTLNFKANPELPWRIVSR